MQPCTYSQQGSKDDVPVSLGEQSLSIFVPGLAPNGEVRNKEDVREKLPIAFSGNHKNVRVPNSQVFNHILHINKKGVPWNNNKKKGIEKRN